jgi:hypothetical protein
MATCKEKITEIVSKKGMYSCMNNTKWRELKKGVEALPFEPPFAVKTVDEELNETHKFDKDVPFWGDWGDFEGDYMDELGSDIIRIPFYAVEWIKVRPRYTKHQGRLMPEVIAEDITEEFLAILKKHYIPYEEDNGAFIIHGYRSV